MYVRACTYRYICGLACDDANQSDASSFKLEFSIGQSEDCQILFCNGFDAVLMRNAPRSSGLLRMSRSQVYLMLTNEHKIQELCQCSVCEGAWSILMSPLFEHMVSHRCRFKKSAHSVGPPIKHRSNVTLRSLNGNMVLSSNMIWRAPRTLLLSGHRTNLNIICTNVKIQHSFCQPWLHGF